MWTLPRTGGDSKQINRSAANGQNSAPLFRPGSEVQLAGRGLLVLWGFRASYGMAGWARFPQRRPGPVPGNAVWTKPLARRTLTRYVIWQGNCDVAAHPTRSKVAVLRITKAIEYPLSNCPAKCGRLQIGRASCR